MIIMNIHTLVIIFPDNIITWFRPSNVEVAVTQNKKVYNKTTLPLLNTMANTEKE